MSDDGRDDYPWTYEHNPAPWWIVAIWLVFLVWGIAYLVLYLV